MGNSRRALVALAIAVALAATLVACGAGDDASDATQTLETSSVGKAKWLNQANEICGSNSQLIVGRVAEREEEDIKKNARGNEVVAGEAIDEVVPPLMSKTVKEIRALGAPVGDEETVEEFLAAMERDVKKLETGAPLGGLVELEDRFHQSGQLATELGLEACAYG